MTHSAFTNEIYTNSEINERDLAWELWVNVDFNLLVAAHYVKLLQEDTIAHMNNAGIAIINGTRGSGITRLQLYEMIAISYNTGWEFFFGETSSISTAGSPQDYVDAFQENLDSNRGAGRQIDNVFSNQAWVEEQVGTYLGCEGSITE